MTDDPDQKCATCGGSGRGVYQKQNVFGAIIEQPESWFVEIPATCPACHGIGRAPEKGVDDEPAR